MCIPVGSPEIVALDKQQRQLLVVMHYRRPVQFAVLPGFGLVLELLAKHLEFVRPFCEYTKAIQILFNIELERCADGQKYRHDKDE